MTYEEKLLEVFARFRGDGASEATLERIEKAANAEVWQHLPPEVRSSWRLRLGYSETHPGQIELLPRRLREDGATPAELEAALRAPFAVGEALDEGPKELRGGMAGVAIGFGGSTMPEVPRPRRAEDVSDLRQSAPALVGDTRSSTAAAPATSRGVDGASISAQAAALGISLPPNESLLGPFLEALAAATHYRERAEAAEAALEQVLAKVR